MSKALFESVTRALGLALDQDFRLVNSQRMAGGDINQAFRLDLGSRKVLLKFNSRARPRMFETEAVGLEELSKCGALLVPKPLILGYFGKVAWLVLEYHKLDGDKERGAHALGEGLARLHMQQQPYFGWHQDNFIGSTPQPNPRCDHWLTFYAEHRLRFQVNRLIKAGADKALSRTCESLIDYLPELFATYSPQPSLLHGDLWAGNWAVTTTGLPAIFDPACYYGDRETDLAMSELFGGFPPAFYTGYEQTCPTDPGYKRRKPLYQLYHVLNHANLFAGGYLARAEQLMHGVISDRD